MRIFQRLLAWDRHAMRFYALEDWLYRRGYEDLAYAVSAISRLITGVEIEPGAQMAGARFLHGQGATIGAGARVGEGTTIFQQVTLGRIAHSMDMDGYPTIGQNCYIYAGARILGPITVGDDAKVAANALVTRDVPAGAIVSGNPARQVGWVEGYGKSAAQPADPDEAATA
ncbi:MAG TPA: DapH/DapD/GlmU-related protein [Acidimicrobiales bacterium]|nr:DapH/DapD/GlmU-related protein [Acidimicrobiales bacterium]